MEVRHGESGVSLVYNIQDILDSLTLFAMGWDAMGGGATTGVWGKEHKGLNLRLGNVGNSNANGAFCLFCYGYFGPFKISRYCVGLECRLGSYREGEW